MTQPYCTSAPCTCWFYEHRVGLFQWVSHINLLISSFPWKPVTESEIRFKINMEAVKVIICMGSLRWNKPHQTDLLRV